MGIESYIRNYRNHYLLCGTDDSNRMSPTIGAGFFSMAYYPMEQLKMEFSFRTEYTSPNRKMNFSPRLAANYYWGNMMLWDCRAIHTVAREQLSGASAAVDVGSMYAVQFGRSVRL